jgi:hypothetical protein
LVLGLAQAALLPPKKVEKNSPPTRASAEVRSARPGWSRTSRPSIQSRMVPSASPGRFSTTSWAMDTQAPRGKRQPVRRLWPQRVARSGE